ncbi:MAG: hypothetical protein H3C54_00680 [Taibaiella sp.]|nr:hypothetical protein [Taibaiella sp.]
MKSALLSRYLLLLATVILVGAGCKKIKRTENSVTVTTKGGETPKSTGGKGGNASFEITPNHNGIDIDSCMVYIKYDASVVPINGQYDDSTWAVRNEKDKTQPPVAKFSGLKPGNYYIYGKGWDIIRSVHVHGGLPFIIIQDNVNTNHIYNLPLMETEHE